MVYKEGQVVLARFKLKTANPYILLKVKKIFREI